MNKKDSAYIGIEEIKEKEYGNVSVSVEKNASAVKEAFLDCFDILVKEGEFGSKKVVFANCDGMTNSRNVTEVAVKPVLLYDGKLPKTNIIDFICREVLLGTEQKTESNLDKAMLEIIKGNLLLFIEGENKCIIIGVQNIPGRSIDEPDTNVQEKGSREGFNEVIKTNLTLVRKRMCTTDFKAETLEIGKSSRTKVVVCYMGCKVSKKILNEVKKKLNDEQADVVLGAAYLRKAIDTKTLSMFSMVGMTERPDTFCAKINEGKIGILVDGTPFALFVPELFWENFQTLDDYLNRAFYGSFMRIIRFISFAISIFLPATFVAIGLFHQELLPDDVLFNIVMMESNTLFSLTTEAVLIHFVYELVREAGLRMPKSIGHAVSIVGALVIGDAAVTAGLIGAPMLIIVAMTALTSLVTSELYQAIAVLRIAFIIVAGLTGLYGVIIGAAALIINLSAVSDFGVEYLSPLTPYNKSLWRDTFVRMRDSINSDKLFDVALLSRKGK